ncbi:phosphoribosylformylglycinamidine synthase [Candidatus Saccharibacteria bacterium]|nr:phosphoribosylformylglycinamidine synthase [Candidatus Saccharibacteria bacterium]
MSNFETEQGMQQIRVYPQGDDPKAAELKALAASMLGLTNIEIGTCKVFYAEGVDPTDAERLAAELFTTPVIETTDLTEREDWDNSRRQEVAMQPGATNRAVRSILDAANNLGISIDGADTGTEYVFGSEIPEDAITALMETRVNETVERIRTEAPETFKTTGEVGPTEVISILGLDDEGLSEISKKMNLYLDNREMRTIQDYFASEGRDPTDCELQIIAARWSDHCCHKTFNANVIINGELKDPFFKRIKDTAREFFDEEMLSAFSDNSGVFMFYDGIAICIKLETHNGPLNIEPEGGSATGSGGVFRDIFGTGKGADTLLSMDIFLFAPLDMPKEDYPDDVLTADHMQREGLKGVRGYGNPMGIPTANGSMHYDPDFKGKSGVLVGAVGKMRVEDVEKPEPELGDLCLALGAPTGRDGIHGANFSSVSMTSETSTMHSGAVQIGEPIAEIKMKNALLEATNAGLVRTVTDCGAAGFSSAVGEMAENIGVNIDISNAPLKYQGLSPWEIWISEAQERMVVAIAPENYDAFEAICEKHGTTATALGVFDGSHRLQIKHGNQMVADLDYEFLNQGPPQQTLVGNWVAPEIEEVAPVITDLEETTKQVLGHWNVCSKEPIVRGFDHEVQARNVLKPYAGVFDDAPNDASVLKPIADKPYGLVTAHGLNPTLTKLDPYHGTTWSTAEAMSNYVAVGGDPEKAFLVNNYIWPKATEQQTGGLDLAVDAVCDSMRALKRPVISGKDSVSMTYKGKTETIESPPTTAITVSGKIADIEKTVSSDFKKPNTTLVMVGEPDYESMGGSVLHDVADGQSGVIPKVNMEQLPKTLKGVFDAIQTDEVLACHDISEGGLMVALAEMSFGGDIGFDITLDDTTNHEHQLFNETAGCFVVEVEDEAAAEELFGHLPHRVIGTTRSDKSINVYDHNSSPLMYTYLDRLKDAWKHRMEAYV